MIMISQVFKTLSLIALIACLLSSSLPALHARSTGSERESSYEDQGGIWKRQEHDHDHDEDEHEHADSEQMSSCVITEHILAHEFSELAEEMSLTDGDGELCLVEEEEGEHGHEEEGEEHGHEGEGLEHNETSHLHNETSDHHNLNLTCSSCDVIYDFVQELLVRLNMTTPCCLGNSSACEVIDERSEPEISSRTDPAKAYGYGFLMVALVSACSLLGVLFLPLLNKNNKFHSIYKYFYALMIALGTSALFCDAILHLIPEAFGLHDHGGEDGHAHEGEGEEEEDRSFIWKGIIVIAGLYLFYLFEVTLHSWNDHSHHHTHHEEDANSNSDSHESPSKPSQTSPLTNKESFPGRCREPTMPHGACRDKSAEDSSKGSILHPRQPPSCFCEDETTNASTEKSGDKRKCSSIKIKPLAWVIILGDAIHNFADGLALGAAISQSLSLGVSTMIAIIFHELPHELGDFAILLSTGLSWYAALLFNFVSSLTAVVGFFVGVAVGTASSEANGWILAAAAGVFLYIALVDLLPELIHVKEKGHVRFLLIVMANIGFIISFVVLLVIAIYEEELNTLITV